MIPAPFAYVRPDSVEGVLAALADPDARVIAGGHSLLPMMKLRFAAPSTLVDIDALGLRGIEAADGQVHIGALTTYADLLDPHPLAELPDAVREAAASVGDVQVRNAGTVGGALALGDPASDLSAAAIAVGATLTLESSAGTRAVPADAFFLGPYTTDIAQQELVTKVSVPVRVDGDGSAYTSFDDPASGYPLVGCAAAWCREGDGGSWRIGVCGIGGRPLRLTALEASISAAEGNVEPDVVRVALAEAGDIGAYRMHLTLTAIERAVGIARSRSHA